MIPQADPLHRQFVRIKSILALHVPDSETSEGASSIVAIILLDYCVDSILKNIMTAGGAAMQNAEPKFHDNWRGAAAVIGDPKWELNGWELPFKPELSNLHKLRNGTQHADLVPSSADVMRYKAIVEEFFNQTLGHCFELKADELSLATLIQAPILRKLLESADKYHVAKKWEKSITRSSIAVARLVNFAEKHTDAHYSDELYDVYRSRSGKTDRDVITAIEKLAKAVKETRDQVAKQMIHQIGLSWKDYEAFRKVTPNVLIMLDGSSDCTFWAGRTYGESESKFALDFAIRNILKMEAADLIHEDKRKAAQEFADDADDA